MTPDIQTNSESFLNVGNGHELYIHDWGNPKAKNTFVFLHGGPGSSSQDRHKRLFDPQQHRVIFFDQRGCGRSLPYGSLKRNTTQELIKDIEKISLHLKLKKFILFGGSWGSCLALTYALARPEKVTAMILNGIFTGTQAEMDWIAQGKFQTFFPEIWEALLQQTPARYRSSPTTYHLERILGTNEAHAKQSAYVFNNTEAALLNLDDRFAPEAFDTFDPTPTKIEAHYLSNVCFLPAGYILKNAHKIKSPVWLVQGRYDMVCPPTTAYELHNKLPDSRLIWVSSGHKAERESWNVQRTILAQWN